MLQHADSGKSDSVTAAPSLGARSAAVPMPPSALRSGRTSPSPNAHAARVSFREPPESSTRSISAEESEDGGSGLSVAELINAERALLGDFANPFAGRSIGGGSLQRRKEPSPADHAIETFKNFFFTGRPGAAPHSDRLAETTPQWEPTAEQQQQTKPVMAQAHEVQSNDPSSSVRTKEQEAAVGDVDRFAESICMSRIPVRSSCSSSTTDSSVAHVGDSLHCSDRQPHPSSASQGSSPFGPEWSAETNKESTSPPLVAPRDVQPHSTDGALSTACSSPEANHENPLTAAEGLQN